MSRVVGDAFLLGTTEKNYLQDLFNQYSSLFFFRIIDYSIMDNHFHLVVKQGESKDYSNEEIARRVLLFSLPKKKNFNESEQLKILSRLEDLSEYVKSIKEDFSRWYNKRNNRLGCFWASRFKSVLVEHKSALASVSAYVALNAVRANIVERPEEYRWSGLFARINKKEISKNMTFEGIFEANRQENLDLYLQYVYATGAIDKGDGIGKIAEKTIEKSEKEGLIDFANVKGRLNKRCLHFVNSVAIGSRSFVTAVFGQFAGKEIQKKSTTPVETGITENLYSVTRVKA